MKTTQQILLDAANVIEYQGWFRGDYAGLPTHGVGGSCIITAIGEAVADVRADREAKQAAKRPAWFLVADVLGLDSTLSVVVDVIAQVNDSQPIETGKDWAIGTLRSAAKLAADA